MESQRKTCCNERLLKLLEQYPKVFIKDDEIAKSKNLMEKEQQIINVLSKYAKKENIAPEKSFDNKSKIGFQIKINKVTFPKNLHKFSATSYSRFIRRCFSQSSKDENYSVTLAAIIIKKMIESKKQEIKFTTGKKFSSCKIEDEDVTLILDVSEINEVVNKMAAWLMYKEGNVSPDFFKYFPHTYLGLLFYKNKKISLRDLSIDFSETKFKTLEELETHLSKPDDTLLFNELIKAIKVQTEDFLILGYLWEKKGKQANRIAEFIKNNCVICISMKEAPQEQNDKYKVKVYCNGTVISVIRELKDLLKRLSINTPYTYVDFLHFLGYIAYFAAGKHYVVFDNEFYSYIEKELNIDRTSINAMLSEAEKNNLLKKEAEGNYKKYSFTFKDYRLIFEGMILAYAYSTKRISYDSVASLILDQNVKFTGDSDIDDSNHLLFKFNRFVVCNISLLYFSDNREVILDELCNIANDFSVQNRRRQIQAIYLLSDYLIDGLPVSSALRNRIWLSTFGTSMYQFMWQKVWPLLSQNPYSNSSEPNRALYFLKYIKNTFYLSCTIDEDNYAKGDAYFNFWICFININRKETNEAIKFFYNSSKIYRYFWKTNLNLLSLNEDEREIKLELNIDDLFSSIKIDEFISLLKNANRIMEDHLKSKNSDVLYYVNSVQLILYTLADFTNFHKKGNDLLEKIEDNNFSSDLIVSFILCDYLTRKYNRKYNLQQYDSMYMLCGPFRLVCAYCISGEEYKMSEEMIKDYTQWIENEQNIRYKALLYRLLSYTNYPTENIRIELEKEIENINRPYNTENEILSSIISNHVHSDNRINSIIQDELGAIEERHNKNLSASFLHYDHIILNNDFLDNPKQLQEATPTKD